MMEGARQVRVNNFVAVPLATIYAQSWPIPRPDVIATRNSFSSGRSLNDGWVRSPARNIKPDLAKTMEKRIQSAPARRCTTSQNDSTKSFLFDSEDETADTVEEFKLTLRLFKRLTKQVKEVNEYMSNQRIYSFKHHLNSDGIASPALCRSQLAAALSRRQIPATLAPNEPITDLGPPTISSRPRSQIERDPQTSSGGSQPTKSTPSRPNSSPCLVYPRQPSTKKSDSEKEKENDKEKKLRETDDLAKEEWIKNDEEFDELFVPEEIDPEDMEFRFHDPYPKNWVDETVEDVCFRGKRKVDPFMHRLDEFEDLQEETVLWEKLKEEKTKQTFTNTQTTVKQQSKNAKRGNGPRGGSARYLANGRVALSRPKSSGNKIKRAASASRSSTTTSNVVSGSEDSDITTFRNSGYDMAVSFKLGSMYPETRPKLKDKKAENNVTDKVKPQRQLPKSPSCEACHYRKTAHKKYRNCKSAIPTLRGLRSQYKLKATECYDIVDIAQTLDPPCKQNNNGKKALLTTEEKAVKKGIVLSKSTFSQRRISLTSEGMAVRGINPALNLPTPPQHKSAKHKSK